MAEKFALVIGCNEYQDITLPRLKTPSGDIQDLVTLIKNPDVGNFSNVTTLLNKPFSIVRLEIAKLFANKGKDDLLLLYFSGHGVLDEQGRLYFAMQDTVRNLLSGSAISANFVVDEMNNSRSKRQLLILDCCHSGAFSRGTKGALGQKVITNSTFKSDSYGRAVLTATDATQYAWEGNRIIGTIENSLFTHYLLEGLRTGGADLNGDGKITSDELYHYTHKKVTSSTEKQKPQFWVYGREGEQLTVAYAPKKQIETPTGLTRKRTELDINEISEVLSKRVYDPNIIIDLITKPFRKEFSERIASSIDESVIRPIAALAEVHTRILLNYWDKLSGEKSPFKPIRYFLYLLFYVAMMVADVIVVFNTITTLGLSNELFLPDWMKHYEWAVLAGSLFTIAIGSLVVSDIFGKKDISDFSEIPTSTWNSILKVGAILLIVLGLISSTTLGFMSYNTPNNLYSLIVFVTIPFNVFLATLIINLNAVKGVLVLFIILNVPFLISERLLIYMLHTLSSIGIFSLTFMFRIIFMAWFTLSLPFQKR